LAQAVLLLIQVGLIGLIARRVFGNPVVGFIAACIAAIYPLLCLHVVVIASLRYRLPFEPLLIILVAEPLAAAWQSLRQRRWRPANS
jgi:hypothetical protein